jgi:hypothetical protein
VPEWREVDTAQVQSEAGVNRDFADAGWTLLSRDLVTWLRSVTLTEDVERLKLRAASAFEHLRDDVVGEGSARIGAALPTLGDGQLRDQRAARLPALGAPQLTTPNARAGLADRGGTEGFSLARTSAP